jgi:hypothetical protein
LRQRSPEALRGFLVANARRFGDERQVADIDGQSADEIEALMHRMTLARSDLAEFHTSSRAWLASRGLTGPTDEPSRRN